MEVEPRYKKIHGQHGIRVPPIFIPELFHSAEKYIPEEDDIVVASYPECGADWMSHIVLLILRMGKSCTTGDEYFSNIPLLEMVGPEGLKYIAKPRCIKTHLPFLYTRYSPKAKYIYIIRNPADCMRSLYQHTKLFPYFSFHDGSFGKFCDLFVKGEVSYNDYFSHFHSWFCTTLYNNVLLITYESMEVSLKENILKIAWFLDEKYHKFLMKSGEKALNEICFNSSPNLWRCTFLEYWRDVFIDNPPSESCHCMLPATTEYVKLKQKTKADGVPWKEELVWEEEDNMELLERHEKELDRYISFNIYKEQYHRLRYFKKKSNILY